MEIVIERKNDEEREWLWKFEEEKKRSNLVYQKNKEKRPFFRHLIKRFGGAQIIMHNSTS